MTDTHIRIASYNIRKARGLDQRRRPQRTLQVINALTADVVLLQEADKRLGPRRPAIPRGLIETETDFELVEVSRNGESLGFHGNALLVRRGIQVKNVSSIDLPGTEPRGALRADLGEGLVILGVHLGLLRRDRRAQLEVLRAAVADAPHVAIAGDFNEWSAKRGLEPLKHRYLVHAPGRTFHARHPVAALDRVALSPGIEMRDAGVWDCRLSRRASDHLPVWTDLAMPTSIV